MYTYRTSNLGEKNKLMFEYLFFKYCDEHLLVRGNECFVSITKYSYFRRFVRIVAVTVSYKMDLRCATHKERERDFCDIL